MGTQKKELREAKYNKVLLEKLIKERYEYKEPNLIIVLWIFVSTMLFIYSFIFVKPFAFIGGLFFFVLAIIFNSFGEEKGK